MNTGLIFTTLIAASLACDDASNMQTCLAESSLGPKLAAAFQSCGLVESRGLAGAVMNKCPSAMELTLKFGMRYKTEFCVFQEIGWLDDEGEMIMDVIDADIATLPASVQAALSDDNLYTCVTGWVTDVLTENQECLASYSSDDLAAIQGLAVGAGHIECFHDIFHGACAEYAGCAQ